MLPATIVEEAPTSVNVPARATLPAAIPAGEGPNGLPMGALALAALAAAVTIGAGLRIAGARR